MRDWMFSSVTSGGRPRKALGQGRAVGAHHGGDGEGNGSNAEVARQGDGIVQAAGARIGRGHHHAEDVFAAQSVGGEGCGEGRIDAAREAQQGFAEAGFAGVIADAQHEGMPDLGFGLEIVFGDGAGTGGQVHDERVLVEAFGAGEHAAAASKAPLRPSKIEVVIAAHLVHDRPGAARTSAPVAEHVFAQDLLPGGEGRGGEVDDGLRAGLARHFDGVLVIAAAAPRNRGRSRRPRRC